MVLSLAHKVNCIVKVVQCLKNMFENNVKKQCLVWKTGTLVWVLLRPLNVIGLFLYPLKTSENLQFFQRLWKEISDMKCVNEKSLHISDCPRKSSGAITC